MLAISMAIVQSVVAQTADVPDVRVGDRWQFAVYYTVPTTQPSREWSVVAVDGETIRGLENGEPLVLTRTLGVRDSPRDSQSNPRPLDFPLKVGKRWTYSSDWKFKPKNSNGGADVEVEVVAYEKLRVPAGELDAFKLRSVERTRGRSPVGSIYEGETVRTYWYAPAARAIAKIESRNPYLGPSTVELVSFDLAAKPP
jgi:hypothetical protein